MFIVFLLSGLWHGANWTFVVWGGLHAVYFLFFRVTQPYRDNFVQRVGLDRHPAIYGGFQQVVTFLLVCFAWIFFRADSLSDAFYIVTHLFSGWSDSVLFNVPLRTGLFGSWIDLSTTLIFILVLGAAELCQDKSTYKSLLFKKSSIISWGVYLGLCLCIMNFGITRYIPFIYFQF